MGGSILPETLHAREGLLTGWSMAACSPSKENKPLPPVDTAWQAIETVANVGAALRALGQWSLDGHPRRFDAEEWWFRLAFEAPPAAPSERVILGLDGLATVAQVWLNGVELLASTNMFIAHACDVGQLLQNSGNTLLIKFAALDAELAVRRKRPRWRAPMVEHQQLRWFRTTLLGRTPGWSPPAAVVGPWKDVWLERRRQCEIQTVTLNARVQGNEGVLDCSLDVRGLGPGIASVEVQVTRGDRRATQQLAFNNGRFSGAIGVQEVTLWWPHTHGEPALYDVTAMVYLVGEVQPTAVNLGRVGFRTLHWDTADGNFALTVNGVPVFCRGACWTPLDPVTLRGTADEYSTAIGQAAAAGMNMLRVAGTMVYEDDHFFDACDAQGVLVWQDFMFANMDFPADDPAFMESVTTEVRQQVARLQSRACLAVLCGNSEVAQQAAMWGAPRELWSSELFDSVLRDLCAVLAPQTMYWPSSAYGGAFPHQGNVGTTSYYGVGAYLRDMNDARRSDIRFATECLAFANVPLDATIGRMPNGFATRIHQSEWKARSPRDLGAGWDFDDVRDHYLQTLFATDPAKLRHSDHDRYLALSRLATGEAMFAAFAEWRRPNSVCKGALVLFWRDLWAGAGWGITDDSGQPKACYHYLKRALQPTTVLLSDEGCNGLFAHVINETRNQQNLVLEVTAWRGGATRVASSTRPISLAAHSGQSIACMELLDHFADLTYAYQFGPVPADVVVARITDASGTQIAQSFHFPAGLNAFHTTDIGMTADVRMVDTTLYALTLTTGKLALGVHIDAPGFQADDDFFHMSPDSKIVVQLHSGEVRSFGGMVSAINSSSTLQLKSFDRSVAP